ncbi:Uncharacterized protein TCM_029945 [Theobroma cacao]|uniref:Uncharacterized protein n=1 Tax=Theobroma cacao TaxID=3641 RepID=A0A061GG04_THECC|nr:Uncharacterized protein TCM_029945 [Theobroma cacao]
MGQEERYFYSWPPVGAPLNVQREDHWRHFDNSVNAVSFGFVATAILISMFLVMAIFERFLRPNSSHGGRNHGDLESQLGFNGKLSHPSPKAMSHLRSEGSAEVDWLVPDQRVQQIDGTPDFVLKDPCLHPGILRHNVPGGALSSSCWGTLKLMTIYTSGVSVLMPGDEIPTFIAHPAPVPCHPERVLPHHQRNSSANPASNSSEVFYETSKTIQSGSELPFLSFSSIVTLDPDDGHGLAIEWIILHVKNLRYKIVVKYGRKFQGQFVTDEMENNIKNSKFEPPFSTMPLKYMTVI